MNKKIAIGLLLLASFFVFMSFGFFHLAKSETVDEHFWKYDRIPQYWKEGIFGHKTKKTYINDKPGVSLALVSGIGLFFEPNPKEDNRISDAKTTQEGDYKLYDEAVTKRVNLAFRLPLLIANALLIIFLAWLIWNATQDKFLTLASIVLIATSSVLIGISQIINPDTLLWSLSAVALFSFFAYLFKRRILFLVITSLAAGGCLLSKYSANILFALFFLFSLSAFLFPFDSEADQKKRYAIFIWGIFGIIVSFVAAAVIFSLGMPAVFIKIKYLYRATIGAPGFKIALPALLSFLVLIIFDSKFLGGKIFLKLTGCFYKWRFAILRFLAVLFLAIIIFSLINVWIGQKMIPFDQLRDKIYLNSYFGLEGVFFGSAYILGFLSGISKFILQFYPLIFSLSPLTLFFIIFLLAKISYKPAFLERHSAIIFFILATIPLFLTSFLFADVLSTIRYSIMLYPLVYFLAALGIKEAADLIAKKWKIAWAFSVLFGIAAISQIISLWLIKPFYFNYTSSLLPKQFLITDSWGYGSYEAAQYLNSLPGAENIVIWADRTGVCQFFSGKCISDYKINLDKTRPDYFVISRRGSLRHRFVWENPDTTPIANSYYNETMVSPVWKLEIDGRKTNFVKIVKF